MKRNWREQHMRGRVPDYIGCWVIVLAVIFLVDIAIWVFK